VNFHKTQNRLTKPKHLIAEEYPREINDKNLSTVVGIIKLFKSGLLILD